MSTALLGSLASEHIALLTACLSTASALRARLARADEVRAVREALQAGTLTEEAVRQFVTGLMKDLKRGESFAHDPTLTALAVAVESLPTSFAEEFLTGLHYIDPALMDSAA